MSEMKTTPKAEPMDIPAMEPPLRLDEGGAAVGVGEEEDVVSVVKVEVVEDGEDVVVSLAPTPVKEPAPLEFMVRSTVLVRLLYGPQPYPIEPPKYKYSTQ